MVVGQPRGRRRGKPPLPVATRDVRGRGDSRRPRRELSGPQQGQPGLLLGTERGVRERGTSVVEPRRSGVGPTQPFEGPPTRPRGQHLDGRKIRNVVCGTMPVVQAVGRHQLVDGLPHVPHRILPVGSVATRAVDGDCSERLGPTPLGPRRHRQVLELGGRQPALDLGVHLVASVGEPPLPALPAAAGAPDEQLATAQPGRRDVSGARSVAADCDDPRPLARLDVEEEVGGVSVAGRERHVTIAVVGHSGDAQSVRVLRPKGAPCRGDDTSVHGTGDRRVRPPVHRRRGVVDVADPGVCQEDRRRRRQPQVDLVDHAADPLPLPQSQERFATRSHDGSGVERVHRRW